MKRKRISNVWGILLMSLSFIVITSCNKDDDSENESIDAVTLNMLNEQNGKTLLGVSDVYINKANNFRTSSSLISDAGNVSGIETKIAPKLSNLVQEAAATPGHAYQVFDKGTIREFPSGVRAIQSGAAYYRVYVVSPITADNNTTGAVVKYALMYPDGKGLPEYEYKLGEVSRIGDKVEMKLPKGAECYWDSSEDRVFSIEIEDGKLQIRLNGTHSSGSGELGGHPIYIRLGNVFTLVYVEVVYK